MPQDHPIASVRLRPVPGWRSSVTMQKLKVSLETQHGKMVSAVNTIREPAHPAPVLDVK
jgi:hypothetical protein